MASAAAPRTTNPVLNGHGHGGERQAVGIYYGFTIRYGSAHGLHGLRSTGAGYGLKLLVEAPAIKALRRKPDGCHLQAEMVQYQHILHWGGTPNFKKML